MREKVQDDQFVLVIWRNCSTATSMGDISEQWQLDSEKKQAAFLVIAAVQDLAVLGYFCRCIGLLRNSQ